MEIHREIESVVIFLGHSSDRYDAPEYKIDIVGEFIELQKSDAKKVEVYKGCPYHAIYRQVKYQ